MGINTEFRMEKLRDQARLWTTTELIAALDGLVELDAMVKGAPGAEIGETQRRLAFGLWVIDHAGGGPAARLRLSGPTDQACSWTTRSLSMAKTQRPSPRSSSSIRSGSM